MPYYLIPIELRIIHFGIIMLYCIFSHSQSLSNGVSIFPGGTSSSGVTFIPPNSAAPNPQNAQFSITFIDASNESWDNEMKNAVQYAAYQWSRFISSSVPITIEAKLVNYTLLRVLASASAATHLGSEFSANPAPVPNARYPAALANSMAGHDINPNQSDILIEFATNVSMSNWPLNQRGSWYTGTSGKVDSDEYDLVSVAMHEIGHGLFGVSSFTSYYNTATSTWEAIYNTINPNIIDYYLMDCISGIPLTEIESSDSLYRILTDSLGRICWDSDSYYSSCFPGIEDEIPIFNPKISETFVSHLNEIAYPQGNPNSLMTPIIHRGEATHGIGALFLCMLKQLGWEIFYEAESESYSSKTGGFGTFFEPRKVAELGLGSSMLVYPNPASTSSDIFVKTKTNFQESYLLLIRSNNGQTITIKELEEDYSFTSIQQPGLYYFQLIDMRSGEIAFTEKVFINNYR